MLPSMSPCQNSTASRRRLSSGSNPRLFLKRKRLVAALAFRASALRDRVREKGALSLLDDGISKVKQGLTSVEEIASNL